MLVRLLSTLLHCCCCCYDYCERVGLSEQINITSWYLFLVVCGLQTNLMIYRQRWLALCRTYGSCDDIAIAIAAAAIAIEHFFFNLSLICCFTHSMLCVCWIFIYIYEMCVLQEYKYNVFTTLNHFSHQILSQSNRRAFLSLYLFFAGCLSFFVFFITTVSSRTNHTFLMVIYVFDKWSSNAEFFSEHFCPYFKRNSLDLYINCHSKCYTVSL